MISDTRFWHGAVLIALANVFISMLIDLVLTLVALTTAGNLIKLLGGTGANVIGRVLGVIHAALAAQSVVDGTNQIVSQRRHIESVHQPDWRHMLRVA